MLEGGQAPRSALEPLLTLHGLVARTRDGLLRVEPTAGGVALTLEPEVCAEDGPAEAQRPAPDAAPASLRLRCLDPGQDYRVYETTAFDPAGGGGGAVTIEAPLVLSPDQAQSLARRALAQARAEAGAAAVAIAPAALALEPGDLVTLAQAPAAGRYRIARIRDAETRRLTLVPHIAATPLTALPPGSTGLLAAPVSPGLVFIDAPLIPSLSPDGRPLVGVRANPWPGPVTIWAGSEASAATPRGEALQPAVFGSLVWDLWPGPVGRFDRGNRVRLRLPEAQLGSVSPGALFTGANAFAVQAPDGVWEVFQAQDLTLVAQGEFEAAMLLRSPTGRRSTAPIPAGAPVVLLDQRLATISLAPHEAQAPLSIFAAPPGRAPTHAAATAVPAVWLEAAKTPLSPAHLRRAMLANGDTRLTWVRCAREGGDAWGGAEPPQEPEGEAYLVEVLKDDQVLRTETVTAPEWLYPAALRAVDFATAGVARFRVRQRGSGGRLGYSRESAL